MTHAILTSRVTPDLVDRLSRRERQVFRLLADGLTAVQIGRELGISAKTADSHLAMMKAKLGCTGRDLLRLATLWEFVYGPTLQPRPAAEDMARTATDEGGGIETGERA